MIPLRGAVAFALLFGSAAAQASAGNVLFALGRVEIQRGGQAFAAARGAPVEVGDTITTGPTGLAQVRLKDGALLSLRYGSTLKVEEFQLPAAAPAAGAATTPAASAPAAPGGGRSVLRLLRGAFRTVTGLIGKNVNDSYRVVTPVATIGIRGTDYSAAYCNADCGKTPDGLYVGVSNGEIELNNDGGQLVLTNDQYGYVKDTGTPPDRELAPPEVLETPIEAPDEAEESETGEGETVSVAEEAPPDAGFSDKSGTEGTTEVGATQPEGDYELLPGRPARFAFATDGFKGSSSNGVYTDDSGALTGFFTDTVTTIGTAHNVNQGADEATGLRWGRWNGGVANAGGSDLDLTTRSLHWVYAEPANTAALTITGTQNYTLVGNTDPTDSLGNVGTLGSATLTANFDPANLVVTSTVDVIINSQVWAANGTGSIGDSLLFSGSYSTVSVDGVSGGTGGFAGFFTDGAAGAGLSFSLSSGGTDVSGAAAFALQPGGQ